MLLLQYFFNNKKNFSDDSGVGYVQQARPFLILDSKRKEK